MPYVSGYANILGNIGDIQNEGIEISLFATLVKTRNFNWKINANWSANKNILVKSNISFAKIGTYLSNEEGRNFNSYFMPIWAGVDPATGLGQWIDSSDKPNANYKAANPQFVGKPQPDGFGAVTNTFSYKNLQLSTQLYYQYGFKVYASADLTNDGQRPFSNQEKYALDRWQKPGDIASNPKRTINNSNGYQVSTRRLYNGDYIKLQNILLSYNIASNLPKRFPVSSLNIYIQANNLAIWTKAQGGDVSDANIQGFTGGASYPNQKTFSLGLNLSF
jgi:hypothetical protein